MFDVPSQSLPPTPLPQGIQPQPAVQPDIHTHHSATAGSDESTIRYGEAQRDSRAPGVDAGIQAQEKVKRSLVDRHLAFSGRMPLFGVSTKREDLQPRESASKSSTPLITLPATPPTSLAPVRTQDRMDPCAADNRDSAVDTRSLPGSEPVDQFGLLTQINNLDELYDRMGRIGRRDDVFAITPDKGRDNVELPSGRRVYLSTVSQTALEVPTGKKPTREVRKARKQGEDATRVICHAYLREKFGVPESKIGHAMNVMAAHEHAVGGKYLQIKTPDTRYEEIKKPTLEGYKQAAHDRIKKLPQGKHDSFLCFVERGGVDKENFFTPRRIQGRFCTSDQLKAGDRAAAGRLAALVVAEIRDPHGIESQSTHAMMETRARNGEPISMSRARRPLFLESQTISPVDPLQRYVSTSEKNITALAAKRDKNINALLTFIPDPSRSHPRTIVLPKSGAAGYFAVAERPSRWFSWSQKSQKFNERCDRGVQAIREIEAHARTSIGAAPTSSIEDGASASGQSESSNASTAYSANFPKITVIDAINKLCELSKDVETHASLAQTTPKTIWAGEVVPVSPVRSQTTSSNTPVHRLKGRPLPSIPSEVESDIAADVAPALPKTPPPELPIAVSSQAAGPYATVKSKAARAKEGELSASRKSSATSASEDQTVEYATILKKADRAETGTLQPNRRTHPKLVVELPPEVDSKTKPHEVPGHDGGLASSTASSNLKSDREFDWTSTTADDNKRSAALYPYFSEKMGQKSGQNIERPGDRVVEVNLDNRSNAKRPEALLLSDLGELPDGDTAASVAGKNNNSEQSPDYSDLDNDPIYLKLKSDLFDIPDAILPGADSAGEEHPAKSSPRSPSVEYAVLAHPDFKNRPLSSRPIKTRPADQTVEYAILAHSDSENRSLSSPLIEVVTPTEEELLRHCEWLGKSHWHDSSIESFPGTPTNRSLPPISRDVESDTEADGDVAPTLPVTPPPELPIAVSSHAADGGVRSSKPKPDIDNGQGRVEGETRVTQKSLAALSPRVLAMGKRVLQGAVDTAASYELLRQRANSLGERLQRPTKKAPQDVAPRLSVSSNESDDANHLLTHRKSLSVRRHSEPLEGTVDPDATVRLTQETGLGPLHEALSKKLVVKLPPEDDSKTKLDEASRHDSGLASPSASSNLGLDGESDRSTGWIFTNGDTAASVTEENSPALLTTPPPKLPFVELPLADRAAQDEAKRSDAFRREDSGVESASVTPSSERDLTRSLTGDGVSTVNHTWPKVIAVHPKRSLRPILIDGEIPSMSPPKSPGARVFIGGLKPVMPKDTHVTQAGSVRKWAKVYEDHFVRGSLSLPISGRMQPPKIAPALSQSLGRERVLKGNRGEPVSEVRLMGDSKKMRALLRDVDSERVLKGNRGEPVSEVRLMGGSRRWQSLLRDVDRETVPDDNQDELAHRDAATQTTRTGASLVDLLWDRRGHQLEVGWDSIVREPNWNMYERVTTL